MKKYGYLKDMLRETLAAGVAQGVEIKRSGVLAGCWGTSAELPPPPSAPLCLIGTVEFITGERGYPAFLGLTKEESGTLETGFCGWTKSDAPSTAKFGSALYKLGEELAKEFATDFKGGR